MKLYIIFLILLSFRTYAQSNIYILNIDRYINQYTADYICENIEILNSKSVGVINKPTSSTSAECIIITFSVNGGITDEINRIANTIQNSQIPVIVHILPNSEWHFSNSFLVPISSPCIAMPAKSVMKPSGDLERYKILVDSSKMNETIRNFLSQVRNYSLTNQRSLSCLDESFANNIELTAEDANTMRVVNLLVANQNELINKLNGQYVNSANGGKVLHTAHATINKINMDIRPQILEIINNPITGYFVLILAFYSLIWSIFNEQKTFSFLSSIFLFITAFYIFNSLPVNLIGIILITSAFIIFAIGAKVKSLGLLQIVGTASLFAGSLLLIDFYDTLGVLVIPFYLIAGVTIFSFLVFIFAKSF